MERGLRLLGWEIPKSKVISVQCPTVQQTRRWKNGKETTLESRPLGQLEVLLSQRGILDISTAIFQGNFTHPFLARKRKEGKPASETRPLTIKITYTFPGNMF